MISMILSKTTNMIKGTWEQNLGQLLYQLDPDTKKIARKLEKKHKKKKVLWYLTKHLLRICVYTYIYIQTHLPTMNEGRGRDSHLPIINRCVCVCVYIYIYIYIYSLLASVFVCRYVYMHTQTCQQCIG